MHAPTLAALRLLLHGNRPGAYQGSNRDPHGDIKAAAGRAVATPERAATHHSMHLPIAIRHAKNLKPPRTEHGTHQQPGRRYSRALPPRGSGTDLGGEH
jgi:hypothetical protein